MSELLVMVGVREVARRSGFSVASVRAWRRTWLPGESAAGRRGPEPVAVGGRVLYSSAEVDRWLTETLAEARGR